MWEVVQWRDGKRYWLALSNWDDAVWVGSFLAGTYHVKCRIHKV